MLNERPIDQWKVTELKDELQQRNLPITGLKDDLAKGLSEDIRGEENNDGETPPAQGLERAATPGSVDASVYHASGERIVDGGVSEVMKHGGDAVVSVTGSVNESLIPTTEASKEPVIGTSESSRRILDAVTEVESSLDDMAATDENHCQSNGVGLESFSSGVITLKEVDPLSECHNDTIDETPEDETSMKMAVIGVPSDVSGISIKLTQEAFTGTAEASQKTLDAVTEVGPSLIDRAAKATNENHCDIDGVDLESASIGNNTVKKVNPYSEGQGGTIEKNPEDNTSRRMVVDDVPSDVSSINTKLGADDVNMKLLEQEAVPIPPNAIALHADNSDADAVATTVADPEEYTGKEMAIDDVSSDVIDANVHLGVDVDCKSEREVAPIVDVDCNIGLRKVPQPPDAIALHADNSDADVVATAAAEPEDYTCKEIDIDDVSSDVVHADANLDVDVDCKSEQEVVPIVDADCKSEQEVVPIVDADFKSEQEVVPPPSDATALHAAVATAESMILKNSFSKNALINGKGYEDSTHTNGDCKLILCGPEDQVSAAKLDLASQTKCVSFFHDNVSTNKKNNVMGNLNSYNSDLELEAKQEIVNPFFTIPSVGDCLQALDGDNKLHKNGAMEESGFTSNMDLDTKEDSPDDNSPEKHLDRSPDDESMDEDLMENMHDVGGKTKVTSEHVFKEVTPVDAIIEGSSGHTKEVVAEEKPPNLTEKRKSEGHESIANEEQIIRRCQWDVDTASISDQKASKLTGAGAPKVTSSSIKPAFGRFNSTANGDSPKERIVPPPIKPATTSLRIDRFVRPFTLKAAQELLGKTGSISSFWMDQIKTHCYVTYSSVEEAVATRNAVYNLQWPPNNGSCLVAEFVDPQEVKLKLAPPPPSPVPINPCTATAPEATTCQQSNVSQTIPPRPAAISRGLLPTPAPLSKLPPTSDPATSRESFPPPPKKLEPALKLDDLFKKTRAYPRIYYMPLSEEEVLAKNAAGGSTWRNR